MYKYNADNEINLNSITNNRIWYSAPFQFNDVFDTTFFIDHDDLLEKLISMCTDKIIEKGSPEREKHQADLKPYLPEIKKYMYKLRETWGIACFSENSDNLLMWAHYSDNHKGFVCEYDLAEIYNQLKFIPVPVIYSDERARKKRLICIRWR